MNNRLNKIGAFKIVRLRLAITRLTDADLAILYVLADNERLKREIDSQIAEIRQSFETTE